MGPRVYILIVYFLDQHNCIMDLTSTHFLPVYEKFRSLVLVNHSEYVFQVLNNTEELSSIGR